MKTSFFSFACKRLIPYGALLLSKLLTGLALFLLLSVSTQAQNKTCRSLYNDTTTVLLQELRLDHQQLLKSYSDGLVLSSEKLVESMSLKAQKLSERGESTSQKLISVLEGKEQEVVEQKQAEVAKIKAIEQKEEKLIAPFKAVENEWPKFKKLVISPDGQILAGTEEFTMKMSIINLQTKEPISNVGVDSYASGSLFTFSPDSSLLLRAYTDGIYMWDTKTGKLIFGLEENKKVFKARVIDARYVSDKELLVWGAWGRTWVFNTETQTARKIHGNILNTLMQKELLGLDYSPANDMFAYYQNNNLFFKDLKNKKTLKVPLAAYMGNPRYHELRLSPDGEKAFVVFSYNRINVKAGFVGIFSYSTKTGEILKQHEQEITTYGYVVSKIVFAPQNKHFLFAVNNKDVHIYDFDLNIVFHTTGLKGTRAIHPLNSGNFLFEDYNYKTEGYDVHYFDYRNFFVSQVISLKKQVTPISPLSFVQGTPDGKKIYIGYGFSPTQNDTFIKDPP